MNSLKIKSIYPAKLVIHSHISHKIALKKYFKGVKNLEIESIFHFVKNKKSSAIRHHFREISRKSTPHQTLDLYNCTSYSYLNFTDALSILKSFRNIKALSLPFVKSQTLLSNWMKLCKFLKNFKFSANPLSIETKISGGSHPKNQMKKQFFQMLKNMRLENFSGLFNLPTTLFLESYLTTHHYPPSLKNFNLIWTAPNQFFNHELLFGSFNLQRFENLQVLGLFIQIQPLQIINIIKLIPKPSKLTHLGLHIKIIFPEENQELKQLGNLLLERFRNLHNTNFRLLKNFSDFQCLNFLQYLPISSLKLEVDSTKVISLKDFSNVLSFIKTLENLDIRLKTEISNKCKEEDYNFFYTQLSKLQRLQSLSINILIPDFQPPKDLNLSKSFAQALQELPYLHSLSFNHPILENYPHRFEPIIAVLKDKGDAIQKLEYNFNQKALLTQEFSALTEYLHFSRIQQLSLTGLNFQDKQEIKRLTRALAGAKNLESLNINQVCEKDIFKKAYVNLVRSLVTKPTLKNFCFKIKTRYLMIWTPYKKGISLHEFSDIAKANPNLATVDLSRDITTDGSFFYHVKW